MQRRVVVGVLAALLALAGGFLLVQYVSQADARAQAGQVTTAVLVVAKEVPRGTAVKDLAGYLSKVNLPKAAVATGAVQDLTSLPPQNVASTTLKPGEQLLSSRFVSPDSEEITSPVQVPDGLQLVSIRLDPQRALGAQLQAGDTVGIFVSATVKVVGGADAAITKEIAHKVLVTRVSGAVSTGTATPAPSTDKAPDGSVMITLAVDPPLAEKVVWAQENGKVWLSLERPKTNTDGANGVQAETVLK